MLRLTILQPQHPATRPSAKRVWSSTRQFRRKPCSCRDRHLATSRPRRNSSAAAVASWQDGRRRQRREKERRPFRLGPGAAVPILLGLAAASIFGPLILAVSAAVVAASVAVAVGAAAFTVFLPLTVGVGVLGLLFGAIFNATVAAGLLIMPLLAGAALYNAIDGRRAAMDSDSPFVRNFARFGREIEETFGLPSRPFRQKKRETASQRGDAVQESKEAREEREARELVATELSSFDELLRNREHDRQRGL